MKCVFLFKKAPNLKDGDKKNERPFGTGGAGVITITIRSHPSISFD